MKKLLLGFLVLVFSSSSGFAQAKMRLTFGPTKFGPKVKDLGESLVGPAAYIEAALPAVKDVPIVFKDCGQVNAFFESGPTGSRIVICYQLVQQLLDNTVKMFAGKNQVDLAASAYHQAIVFAFFHEVGHAYAALSGVHLTGPREDVADQVATYLMWAVDFDNVSALGGLVFFELDAATPVDVWDVHTPDARRLVNLACWSYGAEPGRAAEIFHEVGRATGDAAKLEARAESCAGEWDDIKAAWDDVVELKKEGK